MADSQKTDLSSDYWEFGAPWAKGQVTMLSWRRPFGLPRRAEHSQPTLARSTISKSSRCTYASERAKEPPAAREPGTPVSCASDRPRLHHKSELQLALLLSCRSGLYLAHHLKPSQVLFDNSTFQQDAGSALRRPLGLSSPGKR